MPSPSHKLALYAALSLMLLAALSRLLPHPPNFTPVIALALFAGAAFRSRFVAIAATWGAMLLSDLILGWHASLLAVYVALAAVALIGGRVQISSRWTTIAGHGFAGALLFFALSNLAVWLGSGMYAANLQGLIECYVMAIPFFGNSLAGTAVYGVLMFSIARLVANHQAHAPVGSSA